MPLSLNNLINATNATSRTLRSCNGGVGTNIKLSDFQVGSVNSITVPTSPISYGAPFQIQVNFSSESVLFSNIKNKSKNYVFTVPTDFSLTSDSGFFRQYTNIYNPTGTGCSSSIIRNLNVRFFDQGFNDGIPNYNIPFNASVTLYSPPNPNTPVFSSSTRPPRPCSGGLPCSGATITISYNAGTYQGVSGSSVNIYVTTAAGQLGTLVATLFNASGNYQITNLLGNTTYYITVINNFSCRSAQLVATTPAYV